MKVGDMVTIKQGTGPGLNWEEAEGQVGVITALVKRLYIPAAEVLVLGQFAEFDIDELEKACK